MRSPSTLNIFSVKADLLLKSAPYVMLLHLIFTTGYFLLADYLLKRKIRTSFVHMLPFFFFIYLVMLLHVSYSETLKVMYKEPAQQITFHYRDSLKVSTGADLLFAGQTHNYLFLYNKTTKTSQVFSRDKADQLQFTAK
jgi:hypothetical protein